MKILFLDESGDHNLTKIDDQYPVFVLGGVIVDRDNLENLNEQIDQFKKELFGTTDIILHTADITRNKNGFERLKEKTFRENFYEKLNHLIATLDFKVVACVIKKKEHIAKYDYAAIDPYMLGLNVLVERFYMEIKSDEKKGLVIAEKRDWSLDHELELSWLQLKIKGTRFLKGSEIEDRISGGLILKDKKENLNGLQLADLVVSPIGRHIIGKKTNKDFEIIEQKFRTDKDGKIGGHGLVVLPKDN